MKKSKTTEQRAWAELSAEQRKIVSGMWKHICKQERKMDRLQLHLEAEDMFKERAIELAVALHEEQNPKKRAERERSLSRIGAAWTWLRCKAAKP